MLMLTASLLAPLMYLNRGCMAGHSYESHTRSKCGTLGTSVWENMVLA